MMRLFPTIALALLVATAALSRDVTVRSGEHEGFTRLVIYLPPDADWRLTNTEGGARLAVADEIIRFDTGSVFQRVSKKRLISVSQSEPGAALEMQFGCECVATAFLFQDTMLVVDIKEGTAEPTPDTSSPLVLLPLQRQAPVSDTPDKQYEALALPVLQPSLQSLEDQVSTRLVQGADQSILDLNLARIGPRRSFDLSPLSPPVGTAGNIAVSSVIDHLRTQTGSDTLLDDSLTKCLSDTEMDFAAWTDGRPFVDQLGELRRDLYQEFDHVDDQDILELAKLYAFHGFGAEATQSLDMLSSFHPEAAYISKIADLLDETDSGLLNPFEGMQTCTGDVALWAVLADETLAPGAQASRIEQSYMRLPDHLRRAVGPALSEIFVEAQMLESARRILRAIDLIESHEPSATIKAKASVAEAEGEPEQAEALLSEVVQAPAANLDAPLALARLVEKRWADRGSISPQELDLTASYAVELRKSDQATMMMQTHAVALALSSEFDQAFEAMQAIPNDLSTPTQDRVIQILSERADDYTFLRHAMAVPKETSDALSLDTVVSVSSRMADLGFAAAARNLADRPQDNNRRLERARLRARAALLTNRPHQALLEIADDDSELAGQLRIEALVATGDFGQAAVLAGELGKEEDAGRFLWLADRSDDAQIDTALRSGQLNQATRLLSGPVVRTLDKPLADASGLLDQSANTRENIEELLRVVGQ